MNLGNERMKLCSHIAHYRNMVKCRYHPEFFQKLIEKGLQRQKSLLRKEREDHKGE